MEARPATLLFFSWWMRDRETERERENYYYYHYYYYDR